jgi:excisionase family DNA binding protein
LCQNTTKKDQILTLKQTGLKNCDIARQFRVSKQYVSYVCRRSQTVRRQAMQAVDKEVLTTGDVSRLLGRCEATIRRWSDQGKIPSYRIGIGRRDRRFRLGDLEQIMLTKGEVQTRVS